MPLDIKACKRRLSIAIWEKLKYKHSGYFSNCLLCLLWFGHTKAILLRETAIFSPCRNWPICDQCNKPKHVILPNFKKNIVLLRRSEKAHYQSRVRALKLNLRIHMRWSPNLYLHYVSLSPNLHVHCVQIRTCKNQVVYDGTYPNYTETKSPEDHQCVFDETGGFQLL